MSLIVKNVNKSFADKKVVDNLSFELTKPGVFGLLMEQVKQQPSE